MKLIILQGLPASGKSTWSKKWVNENPKERIRVNRDDIRRMLGPYWIPTREELVTKIEESMVISAMMNCRKYKYRYDIILDATNFKPGKWHDIAKDYSYDIEILKMSTSLEDCIKYDSIRGPECVGEEVIRNMHKKYYK